MNKDLAALRKRVDLRTALFGMSAEGMSVWIKEESRVGWWVVFFWVKTAFRDDHVWSECCVLFRES